MRNIDNRMLISFIEYPEKQRWERCLALLESEYTLSFKDICKYLKCNRSWATRYLKPHLHYIYLSNGANKSANYVRIANMALDRTMTESTWYSTEEFEQFITEHIGSITRQTIRIPIELLIDDEKMGYFNENFISYPQIMRQFEKNYDAELLERLLKKREDVILECISESGKKIWNNPANKYKRSDSPSISCTLPTIDIYSLKAVHDLKDYGDSDEEIYRDLFEQGCYRLVLEIPDKDGVISEKIYYIEPDDTFDKTKTKEMILVRYCDYVRFIQ